MRISIAGLCVLLGFSSTIFSMQPRFNPYKTIFCEKKTDEPTWVERRIVLGKFLKHYHPTPDRCRPIIRLENGVLVKADDSDSLVSTTPSATLACMIKGYKNVAIEMPAFPRFSPDLKMILSSHEVYYLRFKDSGFTNAIWYTSQGEKDALLLLKAILNLHEYSGFAYLCGQLIGYLEKDIYAFYLSTDEEKLFAPEKQQAQAWLQANRGSIEQWFNDNKDRLGIESGRLL
ncbi:MAG: hypothetical protein K2X90_00820 [Candidatus Babeliaceae bacterium]|nr:hypothetical protein [Candidatus Babeliaceae bacterium]